MRSQKSCVADLKYGRARLEEIQETWYWYREELAVSNDLRAFRRALKMLDGTMIAIDGEYVSFHNPSIED